MPVFHNAVVLEGEYCFGTYMVNISRVTLTNKEGKVASEQLKRFEFGQIGYESCRKKWKQMVNQRIARSTMPKMKS